MKTTQDAVHIKTLSNHTRADAEKVAGRLSPKVSHQHPESFTQTALIMLVLLHSARRKLAPDWSDTELAFLLIC